MLVFIHFNEEACGWECDRFWAKENSGSIASKIESTLNWGNSVREKFFLEDVIDRQGKI